MDFVKKNIKWIELGGCGLTIISLFLTFVTASVSVLGIVNKSSATFIEGDGVFVFAAAVVAIVLIILKKEQFALIPLGISLAIVLYDFFNGASAVNEYESIYSDVTLTYGIGFYLGLISLAVSIGALCYEIFVIKKTTFSSFSKNLVKVVNPNYTQPVQPNGQVVYDQSFGGINTNTVYPSTGMSNTQPTYNNFGSVGMPTSQVDTNIFNQQPVAQPGYMMNNQPQPMQPVGTMGAQVDTNMFNQMPVSQSVQEQQNIVADPAAVQQPVNNVYGFSSPATITCPQCRSTLNSGVQFCNQCGSRLN